MGAVEHWEAEATRWATWARTPGHDAYWYHRDAFFALVPPPGRATLEALREPEPILNAPPRMDRYRRIPNFLMLRALKATAHPAGPRPGLTATGRRAPSRSRRTG